MGENTDQKNSKYAHFSRTDRFYHIFLVKDDAWTRSQWVSKVKCKYINKQKKKKKKKKILKLILINLYLKSLCF